MAKANKTKFDDTDDEEGIITFERNKVQGSEIEFGGPQIMATSVVEKPGFADYKIAEIINELRIQLTNLYNARTSMTIDFNFRKAILLALTVSYCYGDHEPRERDHGVLGSRHGSVLLRNKQPGDARFQGDLLR